VRAFKTGQHHAVNGRLTLKFGVNGKVGKPPRRQVSLLFTAEHQFKRDQAEQSAGQGLLELEVERSMNTSALHDLVHSPRFRWMDYAVRRRLFTRYLVQTGGPNGGQLLEILLLRAGIEPHPGPRVTRAMFRRIVESLPSGSHESLRVPNAVKRACRRVREALRGSAPTRAEIISRLLAAGVEPNPGPPKRIPGQKAHARRRQRDQEEGDAVDLRRRALQDRVAALVEAGSTREEAELVVSMGLAQFARANTQAELEVALDTEVPVRSDRPPLGSSTSSAASAASSSAPAVPPPPTPPHPAPLTRRARGGGSATWSSPATATGRPCPTSRPPPPSPKPPRPHAHSEPRRDGLEIWGNERT